MTHPMKCELCPRPSMRDDILCFLCSAMFQPVIPCSERRAIDSMKGQAIFDAPYAVPQDVMPTDNAYYRRWHEQREELFK